MFDSGTDYPSAPEQCQEFPRRAAKTFCSDSIITPSQNRLLSKGGHRPPLRLPGVRASTVRGSARCQPTRAENKKAWRGYSAKIAWASRASATFGRARYTVKPGPGVKK